MNDETDAIMKLWPLLTRAQQARLIQMARRLADDCPRCIVEKPGADLPGVCRDCIGLAGRRGVPVAQVN